METSRGDVIVHLLMAAACVSVTSSQAVIPGVGEISTTHNHKQITSPPPPRSVRSVHLCIAYVCLSVCLSVC